MNYLTLEDFKALWAARPKPTRRGTWRRYYLRHASPDHVTIP